MTQHPSPKDILSAVAVVHQISVEDLLLSRRWPIARARWQAMHLLRITPKPNGKRRSLPEIARILDQHHTTVMHGLRRYAATHAEAA